MERTGESTKFGAVVEDLVNVASEENKQIRIILGNWNEKTVEVGLECENVSALVINRNIRLVNLMKIVDQNLKWQEQNSPTEDLKLIESKLTFYLNEFKTAHDAIPASHPDIINFNNECEMVTEEVISMISAICIHKDNLNFQKNDATREAKSGVTDPVQLIIDALRGVRLQSNPGGSVRLPQLEIPTFDGTARDWLFFKGCYESSIHTNESLSSIDKMRYLQKYVVGEARSVISHVSLSEANYEAAWSLLLRRYDNKKILINQYLAQLINIRSAKEERASELKAVVDEFKEVLFSLKNLGECPWNSMIIFLLCNKLPSETIGMWEQKLGHSTSIPEIEQLSDFLEARIQTLMILESKETQSNFSKSSQGSFKLSEQRDKGVVYQVGSNSINCAACSGSHRVFKCREFLSWSPAQRNNLVKEKKLCSICLNYHIGVNCEFKWNCRICRGQHNSLLHWPRDGNLSMNAGIMDGEFVLLPTAMVTLWSSCGVPFNFKALVDQGSSVSAVSENLMSMLKWKRSQDSAEISGVGESKAHSKGTTKFVLKSVFDDTEIPIKAIIMNKVTRAMPTLERLEFEEFKQLKLADPYYLKGGKIDLILGSDVIPMILMEKIIKGPVLAQQTHLGYIISGPVVGTNKKEGHSYAIVGDSTDELVGKFWETEEKILQHSGMNPEEEACEKFYKETTFVDTNGRYVCKLPFKQDSEFGRSRHIAVANLMALEKKFEKSNEFKNRYVEAMEDYFNVGHAEIAPQLEEE